MYNFDSGQLLFFKIVIDNKQDEIKLAKRWKCYIMTIKIQTAEFCANSIEGIELKKNHFRQNAIRLICLSLIIALFVPVLTACGKEKPLTTVFAASDFQPYKGSKDAPQQGQLYMQTIIRQMKTDGYHIESALLCGDYSKTGNTWTNVDPDLNNSGVAAIAEILETELGMSHENAVYVQGNHDPANTNGLDPFGANDTEHYGVFVIHEDNYQWKQGSGSDTGNENTDAAKEAAATATALESYLRAKVEEKYEKPIFVCSHIPLHYSYRTFIAASLDNIHAKLIFDVLNEFGKELNIIFLFGHNHSDTHDDYLGGGSVYLPAGDTILIDDGEESRSFSEHTLNFTYMNAGYLGYYDGKCTGSGISSTVFAIYPDQVEVARYSYALKDGAPAAVLSPAKEAGRWDKGHTVAFSYQNVNTSTVYEGVQTITLKKFSAK